MTSVQRFQIGLAGGEQEVPDPRCGKAVAFAIDTKGRAWAWFKMLEKPASNLRRIAVVIDGAALPAPHMRYVASHMLDPADPTGYHLFQFGP